jgi:hypothetical protein
MRTTPKSEHLLVKRLEMADRLLKFVSDGDQWPEIVALLTELDEIDPDFDNTLQKLELKLQIKANFLR